ncbi:hypothetical protein HK104_002485 [Borealophlyctis nickersoniae]|nr:hypothetical protein HK104_002485 [Borealophlyctis nickersoniae]
MANWWARRPHQAKGTEGGKEVGIVLDKETLTVSETGKLELKTTFQSPLRIAKEAEKSEVQLTVDHVTIGTNEEGKLISKVGYDSPLLINEEGKVALKIDPEQLQINSEKGLQLIQPALADNVSIGWTTDNPAKLKSLIKAGNGVKIHDDWTISSSFVDTEYPLKLDEQGHLKIYYGDSLRTDGSGNLEVVPVKIDNYTIVRRSGANDPNSFGDDALKGNYQGDGTTISVSGNKISATYQAGNRITISGGTISCDIQDVEDKVSDQIAKEAADLAATSSAIAAASAGAVASGVTAAAALSSANLANAGLATLGSTVAGLDAAATASQLQNAAQFSTIEGEIAGLQTEIAASDAALQGQLGALEGIVTAHTASIGTLTAATSANSTAIGLNTSGLAAVTAQSAATSAGLVATDALVTSVNAIATANTASITALSTSVAGLSTNLGVLDGTVGANTAAISANTAGISSLTAALAATTATADTGLALAGTAEGTATTALADSTANSASITALWLALGASTVVGGIGTGLSTSGLQNQINDLDSRTDYLESSVSTFWSSNYATHTYTDATFVMQSSMASLLAPYQLKLTAVSPFLSIDANNNLSFSQTSITQTGTLNGLTVSGTLNLGTYGSITNSTLTGWSWDMQSASYSPRIQLVNSKATGQYGTSFHLHNLGTAGSTNQERLSMSVSSGGYNVDAFVSGSGVRRALTIYGNSVFNTDGTVSLTNTSDATSTIAGGAMRIAGGLAVAKTLYANNMFINTNAVATQAYVTGLGYLTSALAASTYLTQVNASATYSPILTFGTGLSRTGNAVSIDSSYLTTQLQSYALTSSLANYVQRNSEALLSSANVSGNSKWEYGISGSSSTTFTNTTNVSNTGGYFFKLQNPDASTTVMMTISANGVYQGTSTKLATETFVTTQGFTTSSTVDSKITSALTPYITTSTANSTFATPTSVTTQINSALTPYITTSSANSTFSTPSSVASQIDSALTPYITSANVSAQLIGYVQTNSSPAFTSVLVGNTRVEPTGVSPASIFTNTAAAGFFLKSIDSATNTTNVLMTVGTDGSIYSGTSNKLATQAFVTSSYQPLLTFAAPMSLSNNQVSIDLSGYPTTSFVTNQGYLTSAALSPYQKVFTVTTPLSLNTTTNVLSVDLSAYQQTVTAGTDLTKAGSTLSVNAAQTQITSVGTLTSLTSSGVVTITNTTAASSTTTGALKVAGGISTQNNVYAANVYIGANPVATQAYIGTLNYLTTSAASSTYQLIITAGTGILKTTNTVSVDSTWLNTQISNALVPYVTSSSLSTTLNAYVTNTALSSTLNSYITSSSLTSTLSSYVTTSSLSNYINSVGQGLGLNGQQVYVVQDASLNSLQIRGGLSSFSSQGSYLCWNSVSPGLGHLELVNQHGAGEPIIDFWDCATDHTKTLMLRIRADGLFVGGTSRVALEGVSYTKGEADGKFATQSSIVNFITSSALTPYQTLLSISGSGLLFSNSNLSIDTNYVALKSDLIPLMSTSTATATFATPSSVSTQITNALSTYATTASLSGYINSAGQGLSLSGQQVSLLQDNSLNSLQIRSGGSSFASQGLYLLWNSVTPGVGHGEILSQHGGGEAAIDFWDCSPTQTKTLLLRIQGDGLYVGGTSKLADVNYSYSKAQSDSTYQPIITTTGAIVKTGNQLPLDSSQITTLGALTSTLAVNISGTGYGVLGNFFQPSIATGYGAGSQNNYAKIILNGQPLGLAVYGSGSVVCDSTTDSSSTTTGALQTRGGCGIAKNLYVGGTIYQGSSPIVTTASLGTTLANYVQQGGNTIVVNNAQFGAPYTASGAQDWALKIQGQSWTSTLQTPTGAYQFFQSPAAPVSAWYSVSTTEQHVIMGGTWFNGTYFGSSPNVIDISRINNTFAIRYSNPSYFQTGAGLSQTIGGWTSPFSIDTNSGNMYLGVNNGIVQICANVISDHQIEIGKYSLSPNFSTINFYSNGSSARSGCIEHVPGDGNMIYRNNSPTHSVNTVRDGNGIIQSFYISQGHVFDTHVEVDGCLIVAGSDSLNYTQSGYFWNASGGSGSTLNNSPGMVSLFTNEQIVSLGRLNILSDERMKKDLEPLDSDCLDVLENVDAVKFRWKETNVPTLGFVAQHVQEYVPTAISTMEGTLLLDNNQLVAVLWTCVKKMKRELDDLKNNSCQCRNKK